MIALGIVVAVVAIIALREPNGHNRAADPTGSATGSLSKSAPATSRPTGSTAGSRPPSSSTPSRPSAPASSTGTVDKRLQIAVLNDTTVSGLAQQAAQRFVDGGWTVTRYGNIPSGITDIISTCAYYDPAVAGAQQAAEALQRQFPTIKRTRAKFDGLGSEPVVVVLADDYSAN